MKPSMQFWGAMGTAVFCFCSNAARADFPGLGDDTTTSLGTFRIIVEPAFQPLMAGYPGYDGVSRLNSPLLFDPATMIGRSDPFTHGSLADTTGTPVGTAGTLVSDSLFTLVPGGFQGPEGTREVHTEVRSLNMTAGPVAVRAGTAAPSQPVSLGEVESKSADGVPANDFPAESFFDIFVEVDLPALGGFPGATLYNTTPLLVQNNDLPNFPPKVIYTHGNSSPVPILFKDTNPGEWNAGDQFGVLVLAGHGLSYDINNPEDVAHFQFFMATQTEIPEPHEYALVAGLGLVAFALFRRRKVRAAAPTAA
ncbi:MAG: hypothetical protein HYY24_00760 [Verrucomicrobia bacterium]|nr:hypothetical protein [Verrucomicrobiota bacterium]